MQSSGTAATHHHTQLCYTVAVSSQSRTVHPARKEEDWFLKPQDSFQKIHYCLQTPPWAGRPGCCLGRSRRCTVVGGACWEGVSFPNTCVGLDCICLPVRSHIKCFLCLFHLLMWVWMTCVVVRGMDPVLLPCASWGSNSDHQSWWQVPLPTKLSCQTPSHQMFQEENKKFPIWKCVIKATVTLPLEPWPRHHNTFGKNFLTTLPLIMHMEPSMGAHISNTST